MTRLPRLSSLAHTWLIDIDGTVLSHNGYKNSGDELLPGVFEFWRQIPANDFVVLLSARSKEHMPATLATLVRQGIRYDYAIFGVPKGERIVINDSKPSGLATAIAVNISRNAGLAGMEVSIDPDL
jgi:hypothetical protein